MADRVARVKIQATADLKGFDEASKSLRELQKAVGPADAEIAKVRQEILAFANANKQSEAVINAQINALKQLKQQASLGGNVYQSLSRDVDRLKQTLNGTDSSLQNTARAITGIGRATQSTQTHIANQAKSFEAMRKQAQDTVATLQNLGRQADQLKTKGGIGNLFQGTRGAAGGVFEVGRKGLADIQGYAALVKRLQDQAQTAVGKVARISEGLAAAGVAGAGVKAAADALGGVAGAAQAAGGWVGQLSQGVAGVGQNLGPLKGAFSSLAGVIQEPAGSITQLGNSLSAIQAKISLVNMPLEAISQGIAALGPEGAAVAGVLALAFAKATDEAAKELHKLDTEASKALQGITDETQQLIRKLTELSQAFRGAASMNELRGLQAGAMARFNETPAGTDASRRAANTIASAEARIRIEAQAQADVLEQARQKYRGSAQDVTSLSERLAYLNQAMKLVDQSTTEGSAEYARFASEASALKRQIDNLSNSYRNVADAARAATQAAGEYANQSIVSNYLNRAAVRRKEEIAAAAREALAAPQVLALPAAGQTSFAGQYTADGLGGMARSSLANIEIAGTRATTGAPMGSQSQAAELNAVAKAANAADTELTQLYRAMQALAQTQIDKKIQQVTLSLTHTGEKGEQVSRAYDSLARQIEKVSRSSDSSTNTLRQQRQLWEQLYNAVEKTDPAFQRAARNMQKIDRELERRSPGGGMAGKVGYIGQGIGAIASAGIFGGPEGAIGGAIGGGVGAAFGGPAGFAAGSFIGSSIGAYASMLRQSTVAAGEFSAEIKKLETALRGVAGSAEEYARAQQVIKLAGAELNVPVLEATKGFTQLTAAVKGAGGNVTDAEIVFRGITEAIKATGGGAEEVQASLTAMAQIFSKGKVSAEELQGQLGERLPGAVTLFAQATGRTLPQLQKDLEQGVVGLNDVMKFAASLSTKYGEQASKMAASTEDSTARMKVALDQLRLAFGSIVQPITASVQSIIARLAEMATRALKAVGLVRDGMAELGAAGRARDLQTRAADAYRLLGSGPQSEAEKRAAFNAAKALEQAATRQTSLPGVQQNLRALQQARDVIRQIDAEDLSKKQIDILQTYGGKLEQRIASEQKLLETLKAQRKVTDFKSADGKGDLDRKALDKAKAEAERLAAEQQRLDEAVARAAINLDRTIYENRLELIRKAYDYEAERLAQQRDIWAGTFEGVRAESARAANDFVSRLEALQRRQKEAELKAQSAAQGVVFAQRMEAVTSQAAGSGTTVAGVMSGSFSASQLQSAAREAAKFTGIANMCSESVKAFYKSLGISLPGVTAWADTVRNAGTVMRDWSKLRPGDIVATGRPGDTPHVGVYTGGNNVFHQSRSRGLTVGNYPDLSYFQQGGYFVRPSRTALKGAPTGVNAQIRRDVGAEGALASARAESAQASTLASMERGQVGALAIGEAIRYAQQQTQGLRDQAKALENNNALMLKRMELEQAGVRPELIEAQMKIAEIEQQRSDKIAQITANLEKYKGNKEAEAGFNAELEQANAAYDRQITAINALAQAQTAAGVALKNRIGQLRQELDMLSNYENFIVSMSQTIETSLSTAISSAVTNMVTGAQSIRQTLSQMFAEIGKAFIDMAAQIISKQLVMITLQSILKALGGGGGFSFSGAGPVNGASVFNSGQAAFNPSAFTGGFSFANGGIMTSNGIVPLKRYAQGGVAKSPQVALFGERGPEAYVPLPDGRNIPVKVQQRTEALNRYRPMGANGTVTGDGEMSAAGGAMPGQPTGSAIDVRYTVERINNVEYVTAEQFQQGMRQAAVEGARQGERQTLRRLQQSPSTRRRIGV